VITLSQQCGQDRPQNFSLIPVGPYHAHEQRSKDASRPLAHCSSRFVHYSIRHCVFLFPDAWPGIRPHGSRCALYFHHSHRDAGNVSRFMEDSLVCGVNCNVAGTVLTEIDCVYVG